MNEGSTEALQPLIKWGSCGRQWVRAPGLLRERRIHSETPSNDVHIPRKQMIPSFKRWDPRNPVLHRTAKTKTQCYVQGRVKAPNGPLKGTSSPETEMGNKLSRFLDNKV